MDRRLQLHDLDLEADRDVVVDVTERSRQPESHLILARIDVLRGQAQREPVDARLQPERSPDRHLVGVEELRFCEEAAGRK